MQRNLKWNRIEWNKVLYEDRQELELTHSVEETEGRVAVVTLGWCWCAHWFRVEGKWVHIQPLSGPPHLGCLTDTKTHVSKACPASSPPWGAGEPLHLVIQPETQKGFTLDSHLPSQTPLHFTYPPSPLFTTLRSSTYLSVCLQTCPVFPLLSSFTGSTFVLLTVNNPSTQCMIIYPWTLNGESYNWALREQLGQNPWAQGRRFNSNVLSCISCSD